MHNNYKNNKNIIHTYIQQTQSQSVQQWMSLPSSMLLYNNNIILSIVAMWQWGGEKTKNNEWQVRIIIIIIICNVM